MRNKMRYLVLLLLLLALLAGCGELPSAPVGQEATALPTYPEPTETPLPPPPPQTPRPTYGGPPKPTEPVTPVGPFPTPDFPPAPQGQPPAELGTIWYPYFPAPDARPVLRAVRVDDRGRRWGELDGAVDLEARDEPSYQELRRLHTSPGKSSFIADLGYKEDTLSFWVDHAANELKPLTTDWKHDNFLAWGPNRQIFVRNHPLDPEAQVWLLDPDTQKYQPIDLPAGMGYQAVVAIAVSPDNEIIDATAFGPTSSHPGTKVEIGLRPFPDGDRSVITEIYISPTDKDPSGHAYIIENSLMLSPRESQVTVGLVVESEGELWIIDKTTGRATKLVRGLTWYYPAIWSPNGDYIAFIKAETPSHMRSPANLWLFDMATSTEIQLTHFTDRRVTSLAWSPDGQRLAFAVTVGDYGQVWITSPDGTEQYPVAGPTAPDAPIAWLRAGEGGQ